jgi:hypothetical protein
MEIEIFKKYDHTPFSINISTVQNAPGTWNSLEVTVYRNGTEIGRYLRNYSNYGATTFYPFMAGGEWYALYSASYTATRAMKLHEDRIEDWCGELPSSTGFCPVEFYVPRYIHSKHSANIQGKTDTYDIFYVDCDLESVEFAAELESEDLVSLNYCDFGFLSGCIWGDDSSWKIRYIDLAEIPNKNLGITEKFGYWELPDSLTLKESISMAGWEPGHDWICLIRQEHINLKTNEHS